MGIKLPLGKLIAGLVLLAHHMISPIPHPPVLGPGLTQPISSQDLPVVSGLTETLSRELQSELALLQSP